MPALARLRRRSPDAPALARLRRRSPDVPALARLRRRSRMAWALAALAVVACSREARSSGEAPFRALTFDEACAKAKKEKKIIVLDLFASWCGPCKALDQTTWADSEVRSWLSSNAVAIKIDGDKHRDLAARFELRAFPTIVFAWHTGAEIGRIVGYRDAQQFLAEAKAMLERAG